MPIKETKSQEKCKSRESTEFHSNKDKRSLPRRCVVIRRTFPSKNVEKTELRFVVYKDPTNTFDQQAFLDEVGQFLKEQNRDMEPNVDNGCSASSGSLYSLAGTKPSGDNNCQRDSREETDSHGLRPVRVKDVDREEIRNRLCKERSTREEEPISFSITPFVPNDYRPCNTKPIEALYANHHEPECKRAAKLRKAVPMIQELIEYFACMERHSHRKDIGAMRIAAEQVLRDTEYVLEHGGKLGRTLVQRIRGLNNWAQSLGQNNSPGPSTVGSSSCVNACSELSEASFGKGSRR